MPLYTYKCDKCDKVFDQIEEIRDRDKQQTCECGGKASRDVETELNNTSDISAMQSHERFSFAMGVNKRQIPQAMKKYPGSEYDSRGFLKIKSRKHKLFEMKRRGLIEFE